MLRGEDLELVSREGVVDEQDCGLASENFAATSQSYRQMLEWMQSFGDLQRVGVEAIGTYSAGVLRYFQRICNEQWIIKRHVHSRQLRSDEKKTCASIRPLKHKLLSHNYGPVQLLWTCRGLMPRLW